MKKCSILIVEDEALIALNLAQFLESCGYEVHTPVSTAQDAITSVQTRKPDLILMDIELPGGINGIEAAARIRDIADVPVIYLTAYTENLLIRQARLTAPYGYIVKPFHERELTATIEMALYKHSLDRKLRASEEKYRRLADNAQDMVYRMSLPDGIYRYVSPAATQLTGYSPEEFYATPLFIQKIIPPDWQDYFKKEWDALLNGNMKPSYEYQIIDRAGKIRWLNQRNVLVRDEQGQPVAIEGIVTDITDRKRVDEALRQANRKLNLLSSITRHDINNQLTVLQGYLSLLEMKQPDPTLATYVQGAKTSALRISAMIRFTKEYEQIGVAVPSWEDCRRLVETAAKEVSLGKISVKNDLPDGSEIFADPLIVRVFYNLIDNAVRYGGKITTIRFFVQESAADPMVICEDDGDGVVAEDKEHIFEQGFGKNTGMGLFFAREILSITGITLRETGVPGMGARFEMGIPNGAFRRNPVAEAVRPGGL
jgi:PAS domain S-box-containing protein